MRKIFQLIWHMGYKIFIRSMYILAKRFFRIATIASPAIDVQYHHYNLMVKVDMLQYRNSPKDGQCTTNS